MIVALSGAHRTGKTTVLRQLQRIRPEWNYVSEPARTIAPVIGFNNPAEFLENHGVSMLQAIQISLFAGLTPEFNPVLKQGQATGRPIIVDRTPFDYLAYYDLFKTAQDEKHQELLADLANYFMSQVRLVVYFPIGVFQVADQPGDSQGRKLQNAIDSYLTERLDRFDGPRHLLSATEPLARAREIAEVVTLQSAL
jgi:predicted ATPase